MTITNKGGRASASAQRHTKGTLWDDYEDFDANDSFRCGFESTRYLFSYTYTSKLSATKGH